MDVAIVGAGPVGLMLACELGSYGVKVALFEERQDTSRHPKANTHSARSMELYRRLGIADAFRHTGLPMNYPTDAVYLTRLNGMELARIRLPSKQQSLAQAAGTNERWPTPEPQLRASQLALEPLLRACAERFADVRIHYGTKVTALEDLGESVILTTQSAEAQNRHEALYVIGCDGARSWVRNTLGIRFEGEGGLDMEFMGGRMVATYFRAPTLLPSLPVEPAWQYWAVRPGIRAVMVTLDGEKEFILHAQLPKGVEPASFDFSACLEAVVGVPTPCEIISQAAWRAGQALVSPRYGRGRIALAGDAAHLFTPTGGLGVNTGIEDAANLAWKLAAAVHGWAGQGLLASYEAERRPAALRNTAFALKLAKSVGECPVTPDFEEESHAAEAARRAARAHIEAFAPDEFDHPGLQLGARYDDSPIIIGDGPPPHDTAVRYTPTTAPGGRLPHLWVEAGLSLLDLAGHHVTAIDLNPAEHRTAHLADAARARKVPVKVHLLHRPDLAALLEADLLVVRPDQMVAWRARGRLPLPIEGWGDILDTITGHRAPAATDFSPHASPAAGRQEPQAAMREAL